MFHLAVETELSKETEEIRRGIGHSLSLSLCLPAAIVGVEAPLLSLSCLTVLEEVAPLLWCSLPFETLPPR